MPYFALLYEVVGDFVARRASTPDTATSFAQNDPYVLHGLVKHWKVRPWSVVIGDDSPAAQSPIGVA